MKHFDIISGLFSTLACKCKMLNSFFHPKIFGQFKKIMLQVVVDYKNSYYWICCDIISKGRSKLHIML